VPEPRFDVRPFLKWAGGKRQLLPRLRTYYPERIGRYFEPFVGSGAVFFDLWNQGRLHRRRVRLSDENRDLVGCYLRLTDGVDAIVEALGALEAERAQDATAHYYEVRDARFNPARKAWQAAGGEAAAYTPAMAAMLIYLNRTGYNGLFRLNATGGFNVPAGRYVRPRIVDGQGLRAVAAVLAQATVDVAAQPFEAAVAPARAGDLVYFDPPYAPLTSTSQFRSYTARGFSDADQQRLQAVAIRLAARGVQVLLSNSTAPGIVALYDAPAARAAGLRVWRIPARRAINSKAERRGAIDELLVTNLEPREPGPSAGQGGRRPEPPPRSAG
jgi:DNA adenine methylase